MQAAFTFVCNNGGIKMEGQRFPALSRFDRLQAQIRCLYGHLSGSHRSYKRLRARRVSIPFIICSPVRRSRCRITRSGHFARIRTIVICI